MNIVISEHLIATVGGASICITREERLGLQDNSSEEGSVSSSIQCELRRRLACFCLRILHQLADCGRRCEHHEYHLRQACRIEV